MTDTSKSPSFTSFAAALRQTSLPGTRTRRFLGEVYALVKRRKYLETKGQQQARRFAREELRPRIRKCNRVLKALARTQGQLERAEQRAEEISPPAYHWKTLFHPAEEALADITFAISQIRQRAIDELPSPFRKKQEIAKWDLVLKGYDYPLDRLGWKPAETWFIEQLASLISEQLERGRKGISPGQRYRLIQAIFRAAFQEHKDLKAIKVAIARAGKRKQQASAQ